MRTAVQTSILMIRLAQDYAGEEAVTFFRGSRSKMPVLRFDLLREI